MPRAYERDGELVKQCPKCQEIKPVEAFHRNAALPDGHHGRCIKCRHRPRKPASRVHMAHEYEGTLIKKCPHCKETKVAAEGFAKNRTMTDGFESWCRQCRAYPPNNRRRKYQCTEGHWIKECAWCEETKPTDQFSPEKRTFDKLSSYCGDCQREHARVSRDRHIDKRRQADRECQQRRREDPEIAAKIREAQRLRSKRPEVRAQTNEYRKERLKTDPTFRVACALRGRVMSMVTKQYKRSSTFEIVGCNAHVFRAYLEARFEPGMTWNNHGQIDGWSIDHILPCELFDLTQASHQRACFEPRNTQPLWHLDNMAKGDLLDDGRRARDLTQDERGRYLISHGYAYLFEETPPV